MSVTQSRLAAVDSKLGKHYKFKGILQRVMAGVQTLSEEDIKSPAMRDFLSEAARDQEAVFYWLYPDVFSLPQLRHNETDILRSDTITTEDKQGGKVDKECLFVNLTPTYIYEIENTESEKYKFIKVFKGFKHGLEEVLNYVSTFTRKDLEIIDEGEIIDKLKSLDWLHWPSSLVDKDGNFDIENFKKQYSIQTLKQLQSHLTDVDKKTKKEETQLKSQYDNFLDYLRITRIHIAIQDTANELDNYNKAEKSDVINNLVSSLEKINKERPPSFNKKPTKPFSEQLQTLENQVQQAFETAETATKKSTKTINLTRVIFRAHQYIDQLIDALFPGGPAFPNLSEVFESKKETTLREKKAEHFEKFGFLAKKSTKDKRPSPSNEIKPGEKGKEKQEKGAHEILKSPIVYR